MQAKNTTTKTTTTGTADAEAIAWWDAHLAEADTRIKAMLTELGKLADEIEASDFLFEKILERFHSPEVIAVYVSDRTPNGYLRADGMVMAEQIVAHPTKSPLLYLASLAVRERVATS